MTVDRIENGTAVIEHDGCFFEVSLSELPVGVREGSVLIKTESGYVLDAAAEKERRRAAALRKRRLFRR